ncbi:MAG: DUF6456 domain-containing protein [Hyphomicrobiales bacterium]
MVAPRQAEREAERIFPRLAAGSVLAEDRSGWPAGSSSYVVKGGKLSARSPCAPVDAQTVRYWLGQDWLARQGNAEDGPLVLAAAGLAWLRRRGSGADPYREQHQLRRMVERTDAAGTRTLQVNDAESALGWLRSRKDSSGRPLIDAEQFQAGERLHADFWRSGLSPRVTSNPGAPPPGKRARRGAPEGSATLTEAALAAKQRLEAALDAVGPELSGILFDVCCMAQGLEMAERSHGWPQRSGKVVLQLALTRLARHYGLLPAAQPWRRRRSGIRAWGASGYKPGMDRWK